MKTETVRHTPGPRTVFVNGEEGIHVKSGEIIIAEHFYRSADAALDAAAPDLLAAAEAALGELMVLSESDRPSDEYWNEGGEGYAVCEALRAAIARVKEGR